MSKHNSNRTAARGPSEAFEFPDDGHQVSQAVSTVFLLLVLCLPMASLLAVVRVLSSTTPPRRVIVLRKRTLPSVKSENAPNYFIIQRM